MEANQTAQKVVKIAMFDDCLEVLGYYQDLFAATECKIELFCATYMPSVIIGMNELIKFNPDLIITNLTFYESSEDGFCLMQWFQEVFHEVPIVVLSKHVSDRDLAGLKMKTRCLKAGAVAAFSKFPNYPPAEDFLQFVH